MKKILGFVISVTLCSCATGLPVEIHGLYSANPVGNTLIIIGMSGRLSWPADMIAAAQQNAARKAAMFRGVSVVVESVSHENSFTPAHSVQTVFIDYGDWEALVEMLEYEPEDIQNIDRGILIRFRYSETVSSVVVPAGSIPGQPGWIRGTNLPAVSGYTVAVGSSPPFFSFGDTVMRSVESVLENMALTAYADVTLTTIRWQGFFRNFRVLEFWIDPISGSVYTLAIARLESR